MILSGTLAGGLAAELSGGNFWQGAATGLIVSGLNHFAHQVQEKSKDYETLLRNKLKNVKIGQSIKGKELKFIDKKASLAIDEIKKVSNTKFNVKATLLGKAYIDDGAYILIEDGKTISGQYFDKGIKHFKGISIKTFGLPKLEVGTNSINQFIIVENHGFYRINNNNISSFSLID
jgi:hypothetical protein